MKLFHLRQLILLAASVSAVALLGTAGATPAFAVTTTSNCTFGSSSGNVRTCINVTHNGTFVDSAKGTATVINVGRNLEECIFGPDFTKCSGFKFVSAGSTLSEPVTVNRTDPGKYCAVTKRKNSDGTVAQIGTACVTI